MGARMGGSDMAQFSGTFDRQSAVVPAVAGLIVAAVVALGIVSWGLGPRTGTSDAPRGGAPGRPVRTDRAAILGGIQSAYLAGIAADWYVAAPRTDRAAILGGIQSAYLAGIAEDWYATAPAVDRGMIQSEYLLEISRDW
jgi:hypothetical protein